MSDIKHVPGDGTVAVMKDTRDGSYIVQLTLAGLPSAEMATKIAVAVELAVNDAVREIGGKIEGWDTEGVQ